MEGGGASKWSIANLRSANEELRQHVSQLKRDLEQERKQSRQAHREKVAGIRTARDEEQAKGLAAREDLKHKMNQERVNEVNCMCMARMLDIYIGNEIFTFVRLCV